MFLGIIGLICAVWVIYDIVTYQKRMEDSHKIVWIICAILFNVITAIVYYFVAKEPSTKSKSKLKPIQKRKQKRKA